MTIIPDISEIPPSTLNLTVAVAIAAGALYCFLGYRTLRFVIGLTGFLILGVVAAVACAWLSQDNLLITAIGFVLGGFVGAIVLMMLYRLGVFSLGMAAGAVIAETFLSGRAEFWVIFAILGSGLAGGLIALVLERPVMTIATAAIGAWMIVFGVAFFYLGPGFVDSFNEPFAWDNRRFALVGCWAVLSVAGALAQFSTYRPSKPPQAS